MYEKPLPPGEQWRNFERYLDSHADSPAVIRPHLVVAALCELNHLSGFLFEFVFRRRCSGLATHPVLHLLDTRERATSCVTNQTGVEQLERFDNIRRSEPRELNKYRKVRAFFVGRLHLGNKLLDARARFRLKLRQLCSSSNRFRPSLSSSV